MIMRQFPGTECINLVDEQHCEHHAPRRFGRIEQAFQRNAEMAFFEYFNGIYNPRHRQSGVGRESPLVFKRKVA